MSVILMYHSVSEEIENPWIEIRESSLAEQLDWVVALGYTWVSLEDALARPREPVAAVTFDDGLKDFVQAAEILRARSVPVTLFVCPGLIGGTSAWTDLPSMRSRPLLGFDEIRDLARQGVEIGCHGWTHTSFLELSPRALDRDLRRCAECFSSRLGLRAPLLAYPYGKCDLLRAEVVARLHDRAVAVDPLEGVPARLAAPRACCCDGFSRRGFAAQLERFDLASALDLIPSCRSTSE